MNKNLDYWELRAMVSKIIPRMSKLENKDGYAQKEKGRKSNYHQYSLKEQSMVKMERLLDAEEMGSFAEVSLRAQSCPMPFNLDIWDGLKCPYRCKYCFADYFRHSLYTSFFDNGKKVGLRTCSENHWRTELDKLMPHTGERLEGENTVLNAVRKRIPARLGIRFEDFTTAELKTGASLKLLNYLKDANYPTMINTKSDILVGDAYVKALGDNKAGAAVHFTLISSDEEFLKNLEPGAPSFVNRLKAAKALVDAGVRVVARIEPWMVFLNDDKSMVDDYIQKIKAAGIRHLTFDSYSYSAKSKGIAEQFYKEGLDFNRMFLLSSDSQWLSSLLLGKFMEYFQKQGLNCSTFDQGNVPINDDWICCSVGDWFEDKGGSFNYGCGVIAIKYIQSKGGAPVSWREFEQFVIHKGGWLSNQLRKEVYMIWNGVGDAAWPIYWSKGLEAVGHDSSGVLWRFVNDDYREKLFFGGKLNEN